MTNSREPKPKCLNIRQGEYRILQRPDIVLATVLGSCVSACLRDAEAGVGGMNHFLLPGDDTRSGADERYGAHLMELLINALLQHGAKRERLEAKLFGGAKMLSGLSDVGARNAIFARRFLETEGIPIVSANLGGVKARRIEYFPLSGRARMLFLPRDSNESLVQEPSPRRVADSGTVEFF